MNILIFCFLYLENFLYTYYIHLYVLAYIKMIGLWFFFKKIKIKIKNKEQVF